MTTVPPNTSVLRIADGQWTRWRAGAAAPEPLVADAPIGGPAVVAVPAEAVRLLVMSVSANEAKHFDKSLPFLLEEEVAEDIDALHFAAVPLAGDERGVAVVGHQTMRDLAARWGDQESVIAWLPEPLLLPWRPGECVLVIEGNLEYTRGPRVLLRWDRLAGTALPLADLPLLLAALPTMPDSWIVYGSEPERVRALLPADAAVDCRVGDLNSALLLAEQPEPVLDLRQGAYAPQLPWQRWWRLWQPIAVAASVALVLQFGVDLAYWQRLSAENTALREAIQASYRRANPRGAVVDVERQLDRQLAEVRGGEAVGQPFTPLLTDVLKAVAEEGDIDLATLNYSGNGDLRINMTAEDFAAVESLRGRLGRVGLSATLEGTTARGERVAARLVVARS